MSREIKFRAFDAVNQAMVYNVNINDGKPVTPGYQWFSPQNTVHDSIPMQYTGFRDKNDVDIYEGDVLKGTHYMNGSWYRIIGEVVFSSAQFCIDGVGQYENIMRIQFDPSFEVIGNIYEHPNLLEDGETA